ncbi:MAG TPA: hypothetical protein VGR78_02145 [Verrucomicrobiae bacterium]|nr:hypothetical protein [Verrucomicrobiae bacterium]
MRLSFVAKGDYTSVATSNLGTENSVNIMWKRFNNLLFKLPGRFATMGGVNGKLTDLPALSPPGKNWKEASAKTPAVGEIVLYRTAYYQMPGYIDTFGRWVAMDGQEEEHSVRWWREFKQKPTSWPERTN